MFRASSRPSSGAQQLQQQPLVLPLEHGGSSAVGCGQAGYRPDHDIGITIRAVAKMQTLSFQSVQRS